ncbi:transcription factor NF-E2 45 kDa subunit-like [Hypanus sabinus]|uniref:transcription factor NF-E2 45 kDa subunit-like n=1 Tax=Hypanus sabinus TaxID=79690 RepID=UPI0028C3810B|nr:transcription factor NF-E2 45 kDa subunit-like [Hypanus sabinus]
MCSTDCVLPFPGTGTEFTPRSGSTLELNCEVQHGFPSAPYPPLPDGTATQFLPSLGESAEQTQSGDVELNWQELMSLTELQGLEMTAEASSTPSEACIPFYPTATVTHPSVPLPEPWTHYPLAQPLPPPPPEPWLLPQGHCHDSALTLGSGPETWGGAWDRSQMEAAPCLKAEPGPGLELGLGRTGPGSDLKAELVGTGTILGVEARLGLRNGSGPKLESGSGTELGFRPSLGLGACLGQKTEHEAGIGVGFRAGTGTGLKGPARPGRETCSRDERRARALCIPIPTEAIVQLPVEEYNELLSRHRLSEAQLALVRDIRRRGKNKVAARHCRRRKLEAVARLQRELGGLRGQRERLAGERERVGRALLQAQARLAQLGQRVLAALRDPGGHPYPPGQLSLQVGADGGVFLLQEGGSRE